MEDKLKKIQQDYLQKIQEAKDLKELDTIFLALFGKNGEITLLPKEFSKLPKEELQKIGPLFNAVKIELENAVTKRRKQVREESYKKLVDEKIDIAKPVEIKNRKGSLHPITKLEQQTIEIFKKIGFQQYQAPQIDTDEYNFELLNIPGDHPARDLWDTLYIDSERFGIPNGKILLRTHTSNGQIRSMKDYGTPLRIMLLDHCFRYENLDARHEHTFDQFEIVYVDKNVSMTNLQYLSEIFLKDIFGPEIAVRMLPKYYPFVEPGAAVEGQCIFCKGEGCRICGKGWLELTGAGMIHPTVLRNGGIDPSVYSGIAWGFGIYRIAMLKFGVEDIREFNSGDLKILERMNEKA